MLIELVKNKEPEWKCRCNGANISVDINNRAYITINSIRFWDRIENNVKELCQYPYTLNEFENGNTDKYRCKKCDKIPYRIIKNKEKI